MRGLSIAHIVIGCILLGFGVADHQVGVSLILNLFLFTRDVYFGVWSGVWVSIHYVRLKRQLQFVTY